MKVLWISARAPISNIATAGSKTHFFYYSYLKKYYDITIICTEQFLNKQQIEKEIGTDNCYVTYWGDKRIGRMINVESKINPLTKYAGVISNYDARSIIKKARHLKKKKYNPDVIIFEWTSMVMLIPSIKKIFPDAKIIASEHDVTFIGYERKMNFYSNNMIKGLYWKIRFKNEKKKELYALSLCDKILPQNKDNISILMQNGVDSKKCENLCPYYNDLSRIVRKSNQKDILFYGAMGRRENYLSAIWFIDNVMPLLRDIDVRFVVLGSNPHPQLTKYSSNKIIVTGFVDSIEPYFTNSMCLVAPLILGAGIKVKIIEAFSAGIPVLTNEIGIEGIGADKTKDYYHCEKPEEYAQIIKTIFYSQKNNDERGVNGKTFFVNNFSLKDYCEKYKTILDNL